MGVAAGLLDQLDGIGDWGLLATNTHLSVTGWNRWLEKRSGLAAAEVLGRPLLDLFPQLTPRGLALYFRQALSGQTVILSQRFHQYVLPLSPTITGTGLAWMQQTARIVPLMD